LHVPASIFSLSKKRFTGGQRPEGVDGCRGPGTYQLQATKPGFRAAETTVVVPGREGCPAKRTTGQLVQIGRGDEAFQAFVPAPLPPEPPLKLTTADQALLEKANRALGKLDGMTSLLPETTRRILALFEKDRRQIEKLGRAAASAFRVVYRAGRVPEEHFAGLA
jgi:hypothetical protein